MEKDGNLFYPLVHNKLGKYAHHLHYPFYPFYIFFSIYKALERRLLFLSIRNKKKHTYKRNINIIPISCINQNGGLNRY